MDSSSPSLTHVTVDRNACANSAGGIFIYDSSSAILEHVTASRNSSSGAGGIYIAWSSPMLDHVDISGNTASGYAGLIVSGVSWATTAPTLRNVLISCNTATNDYGGMKITQYVTAELINVAIVANTANDHSGLSITHTSEASTLSNVAIVGNESGIHGGGLSYFCLSPLTNVIVSDNTAVSGGGGMYAQSTIPVMAYCDTWGNSPDDFYYGYIDPTGTDGNISVDPEFLDTTSRCAADWDLHLATTSPLIDAGDPSVLDPDGGRSDIGVYGGPGAGTWDLDGDGYPLWWQPGPYDPAYAGQGWDCDDRDPNVFPGSGC